MVASTNGQSFIDGILKKLGRNIPKSLEEMQLHGQPWEKDEAAKAFRTITDITNLLLMTKKGINMGDYPAALAKIREVSELMTQTWIRRWVSGFGLDIFGREVPITPLRRALVMNKSGRYRDAALRDLDECILMLVQLKNVVRQRQQEVAVAAAK